MDFAFDRMNGLTQYYYINIQGIFMNKEIEYRKSADRLREYIMKVHGL